MKKTLLFFFAICGIASADYQTGIDLVLGGVQGTDYEIESFYSDPLVLDRKVVFIKSATEISFAHNARNTARTTGKTYAVIGVNGADGIADTGDEGIIRYKIDGDLNWGKTWTARAGAATATANPAYTVPLTFATMVYPDGQTVLGRTGDNGQPITSKDTYFTYGLLGGTGNEWHTITVADDDWFSSTDEEWRASDGKVYLFVVNPKSPALKLAKTGTGKWYTTPPKTYFIPKIHDQTTYFETGTSGTVSITLKDINGNNVFYRIGTGSFIDAGSSTVTLADSDFATGTNSLQYYYAGNVAFTRTRTVVKNPGFPSSGETHGYLMTGDSTNHAAMIARLAVEPYKIKWTRMKNGSSDTGGRVAWATLGNVGLRNRTFPTNNAMLAAVLGNSAAQTGQAKTYAQYAKEQTLQNLRTIDPVGFEQDHRAFAIPTRELYYRGYYDVISLLDFVYAYDFLIANYRSDQHANGITPVEDYFLRDCIADDVFECMKWSSDHSAINFAGMWPTARRSGALVGMLAIPTYSTPYYGTNGLDGNTTVYPWTPQPNAPLTWKQVLLDEGTATPGYPDLAFVGTGMETQMWTSEGNFTNNNGYIMNMMEVSYHEANALAYHYPSKNMPNFELAVAKLGLGTIIGELNSEGAAVAPVLSVLNSKFPDIAGSAQYGVPYVTGLVSSDPNSDDQRTNGHSPYVLAFYDVNYVPVGDAVAPTVLSLKVDDVGDPAESALLTVVFSESCGIGANGATGMAITSSLDGSVVATYKSGAGSATWTFDLEPTIHTDAAVSASYSTVNGIEDTSGNDLGAFSGAVVANNSTQVIDTTLVPRMQLESRYPRGGHIRR